MIGTRGWYTLTIQVRDVSKYYYPVKRENNSKTKSPTTIL